VASVRSVIELAIIGSTRGLGAAAAEARAMAERIAAAEDRVSDARRRSAEAESRVTEVEARLNQARARSGAAAAAVADAENRVNTARSASQSSANDLHAAEVNLAAVRGFGGSAQEVAQAEARLQAARQKAVDDAHNLALLEQRLDAARRSQGSSSAAVTALEERLARARGQQFRASEDLARAENALNAVRRRGTDDMNRQRDGILGIFDALGRLADAFTGADGASTSLLSKLAALNSVFSTIGGPIVQAVVGLAQFAAIMGALGEIVGVVGGLIGQALAGVPALLLAIGAAAGTVFFGLDGIKKAAEVMTPAFDKLKASVSEVFVRQLTPAFRDLAAAIPKLTDGFRFIAVALSGIAQQVIGFVTSARGIEVINGILRGTATLFSSMAPGIAAFVQGLLEAANVGKTAFAALGEALGSILGRIGEVFTRLAGDGTIARAVQGLAATLTGLGAVIAPLIELFIRMGAALGDSVGVALQGVGSTITQVTPFFVKLADVAGKVLVDAFRQLGPPIRELIDSILPGAGAGLDGFASIMHNVVLPAIAGFINFLRTDGIPGIVAFTKGAILQFLEFATAVTSTVSSLLGVLSAFFKTLAVVAAGTPLGKTFLDAAAAAEGAKVKVDGLTASLNGIKSKVVDFKVNVPSDRTTGEQGVLGVAAAMDRAPSRESVFKVNVPSDRLTGEQGILGVAAAQARVTDKTVTTTANVPSGPTQGTLGNQVLEGAIGAVINKSVTTTSNVPGTPVLGTQGNQALKGAIDQVRDKTTTTRSNVVGEAQVRSLKGAIDLVKDKTVTVTVQVKGAGAIPKFASGGRVPTSGSFLVGESGPELLSLDALGAIVTPASRTRQILSANQDPDVSLVGGKGKGNTGAPVPGGGDAPITVNVMLSQDQIAGIAQVEIARRDRATKRTVLAGSGVTF
jgi:hypothetical protein